MTRFVLDCSVTMAWCFESEADRYSRGVLAALAGGTAIVPALWVLEVANVLLVAERHRRLPRADGTRFLKLLGELPVVVETATGIDDADALIGLGREHTLSAYDATYLRLAMRERIPLATKDAALRTATRAAAVPLFGVK